MKWSKDFKRVSGQIVNLIGTEIYIYQWNTGKNKNFLVENRGATMYEQHDYTIPGKGDEAMQKAIDLAKKLST